MGRKYLVGVLLVVVLALVLTFGAAPVQTDSLNAASGISYGSAVIPQAEQTNGTGETQLSNQTQEIRAIYPSDEVVLKEIEKIFGPETMALAKHRVTATIDLNSREGTYYIINPVPVWNANWCGYSLNNVNLVGVRSTFNVKHCTGADAFDGTWIGLGGHRVNNLIQTGVDQLHMYAWVEALPGAAQFLFWVNQNDSMSSSVGREAGGYCRVVIMDNTTGSYWAADIAYPPTDPWGDWIVETPCKDANCVQQYHIGHFGTVSFTDSKWWDTNEVWHTINEAGTLWKMQMNTVNGEVMIPSNLGGGGTSFSVTRN